MRGPLPAVLLCSLFLALSAQGGRGRKAVHETPKTVGLGHPCASKRSCKHQAQICIKGSDANGKQEKVGFCALPCLAIDAGTTKVIPGQPITPGEDTKKDLKKKPPPRCPPDYQCRSAGAGVPVDLCMKE